MEDSLLGHKAGAESVGRVRANILHTFMKLLMPLKIAKTWYPLPIRTLGKCLTQVLRDNIEKYGLEQRSIIIWIDTRLNKYN